MRKFYFLLAALSCFATASFAQFNYVTNANIGQTYTIDSVGGIPTGEFAFKVHFNTKFSSISYTASAFRYDNCQTQKGLQCKVYANPTTTTNIDGGLKCNNYGANGNPYHAESVDSLKAWLKKAYAVTAALASPADTAKYTQWKPSMCLFNVVKGDTTNQAFGCYPGCFKRIEYGFQFDFTGRALKKDVSFTMDTYDPGTTGKNATYKLVVYGTSVSAANIIGQKDNFYVTGSGKKVVNLGSELGIDFINFGKKKIFIMITTQGTDSVPNDKVYEPIVIFDDFATAWGAAKWTAPAATTGMIYNSGGAGIYTPYTLDAGTGQGTVKLRLKDEGRIGTMTLINDVQTPPSQYQFLDTLGIFANDGNGNYNVRVPYVKTPSKIDEVTGNYTKSYITIAAPTISANDDIEVLMSFTPSQSAGFTERVEINNSSVRFWWDVQTMSKDQLASVSQVSLNGITAWSNSGMIHVKGSQQPVTLYNALGQKLGTYRTDAAQSGISVGKGLFFVSTSEGVVKVMVK